jgi:LysR family hydrogen peroxide-inducible transcriptional activator
MTLTQLKYILAVENHLNFIQAAEECHVAQPSLSAQIKKLEEELGVVIFDRGRHGVSVTEQGHQILEQARVILNEAERLNEVANTQQKAVKGTLKLGMIPTIGPYLLPHFLEPLHKQYPDLNIQLTEDKTESLVRLLEQGKLDAAILSTPEKAPANLMEKVLYYEPFVIFAHESHALLKNQNVKIDSLKNFYPILLDETHCMRDQVEEICAHQQTSPNHVYLVQGTLSTLITIVDHQNSFTLLPSLALDVLSTAQKKNQVRPIVNPIPTRKVSLVYHKSFVKRSMIEALNKVVVDSLPPEVEHRLKPRMEALDPKNRHFSGT